MPSKPRPTTRSPEVFLDAKDDLIEILCDCPCMEGAENSDVEKALGIISSAFDHDGFKLAKDIEGRLYCDCCLEDAEQLDNVDSILMSHRDAIIREWVKAEKLVIPHKIGDTISFTWGEKDMTGVVEKLNPEDATLTVKVEGESGKPIVYLESVK